VGVYVLSEGKGRIGRPLRRSSTFAPIRNNRLRFVPFGTVAAPLLARKGGRNGEEECTPRAATRGVLPLRDALGMLAADARFRGRGTTPR